MLLIELLPERLVLVLAHFVWQGALLAAVSGAAAWLLERSTASARYAVHLAVLVAMLATPLVTVWQISATELPPLVAHELPGGTTGAVTAMLAAASTPAAASAYAAPVAWSSWLSAAYLLSVALLSLRLVGSLVGVERLRRRSAPVTDSGLLAALARQTKALGLRATPALAWSRDVAAPAMVGLLKPAILLPWAMADGLTVDQLELILAHELAHIRRLDAWVVLAQRLAETWFFFHPGVWWVSRQVSHERELCCDDLVLAAGAPAVQYADALVRTAEFSLGLSRPAAMVLSALGDETALGGRVRRLLCGGAARPRRTGLLAPLGVAAAFSMLITAAGSLALMAQQTSLAAAPSTARPASTANDEADAELDLTLEIDRPQARQRAVRLGSKVIVAFGEETEIGSGRIRVTLTVHPAPHGAENAYVVATRVVERTIDGKQGLLSAPQVLTRGGEEATITIGEEGAGGQRIQLRVTVTPQRAPARPAEARSPEAAHALNALHYLWKIQNESAQNEPAPEFGANCPAGVVAKKLPALVKELRCSQCHASLPERTHAVPPPAPRSVLPSPPPPSTPAAKPAGAQRRRADPQLYFELTGRYPKPAELDAFQRSLQSETLDPIIANRVEPYEVVTRPATPAIKTQAPAPTTLSTPVRATTPAPAVVSSPAATPAVLANAAEEVTLLERLVASYKTAHERVKQMHDRGLAPSDELGRSEREMLEAMLRLHKARAAYEALRPAGATQPAP